VDPTIQAALKAHSSIRRMSSPTMAGLQAATCRCSIHSICTGLSGGVLTPSAMVLARASKERETLLPSDRHSALHFIWDAIRSIACSSALRRLPARVGFYSVFWTNLLQNRPVISRHINGTARLQWSFNIPGSASSTRRSDMTEPGSIGIPRLHGCGLRGR